MNKKRKLRAILFADMNERFPTAGRDESLVDFQAREPRSGWEGNHKKYANE